LGNTVQSGTALSVASPGLAGARTPFLVAIVLDCIYQLVTVQFIYPLELLFTATLLALIPYILLRGRLIASRDSFYRLQARPIENSPNR
jgi:hypothetical protein